MSLILHLSDLHLGRVKDADIIGDFKSDIPPLAERISWQAKLEDTLKQLSDLLRAQNNKLDAIVISGDITVADKREGFEKLEVVLGCLGDLRPTADHIVVVPGNHDVTWEVSDDPATKYQNFLEFVRNKGYITPPLEGIDFVGDNVSTIDPKKHYLIGPENRWAILPINSSHYCGSLEPLSSITEAIWKSVPDTIVAAHPGLKVEDVAQDFRRLRLHDVARLTPGQLKAIRVVALAACDAGVQPTLISVLHHQLLPVTAMEEFKAFESITNLGHLRLVLRDNNISMILHGHKHASYVYYDYASAFLHRSVQNAAVRLKRKS